MVKQNKYIVSLYLIFLITLGSILIIYSKESIHLAINSRHSAFGDIAFKYLTYLGDGVVIIGISVLLLLFKFKWAIMQVSAYLISGVFVQVQKRFLFKGMPRPAAYFEDTSILNFIEGVKIHHFNTFPSGHTTSAFAFFFCAIFFTKSNTLKTVFFILAWLVGLSRIYLNEHFLIDVYFGAIYGVISVVITFWIFKNVTWNWFNKGILTVKK